MSALTFRVEENISNSLLDCFAFVFDGKINLKAHYMVVFATPPNQNVYVCHSACLALLALEDETTQDAHDHIFLLLFVLEVFG